MRIDVERLVRYLENNFDANVEYSVSENGYIAKIKVGKGTATMEVFFVDRGARIQKPNGTHKYYYEVSNAQLISTIKKIVEANKYRA